MMIDWLISPGLVMIVMSMFVGRLNSNSKIILLLAPLVSLLMIWMVTDTHSVSFMGHELLLVQPTRLGQLFATTFSIMAFGGLLFAWKQATRTELSAVLLYAGSAISAVSSGDFITFFIFWELMAVGSTIIIFSAKTVAASQAGLRYALIHLLSGMILLYGIIGVIEQSGDASLRMLSLSSVYEWMILIGFLINAGAPPLSAWVADAYPEASVSGTVFLSAFTTKTAVFALLVVFAGASVLIPIGIYMIFYGIIYALLENDMRRILSYSIVNQVGFMVAGTGIGSELAVNGVAAHASAHIIYKALLMMSAGSVLYVTGQRKCSNLGGLHQTMRLTMICGVIGAISISSVPWTSGFVSKSLISEAAHLAGITWVWLALLVASAGVFLHAGIKFPWFVFFQDKPQRLGLAKVPANMQAAMIVFSLLCIGVGVFPQWFYQLMPFPVDYQPYTLAHIISQSQLLLFSMIAFFLMLPLLKRTLTITLDFDWFYRRLPHLLTNLMLPQQARTHRIALRAQQLLASVVETGRVGFYWIGRDISTTGLIATLVIVLSILLILYY